MKRFISILLSILIIFTCMTTNVFAEIPSGTTSITDGVATKIKNANTTSTYDSTKLNTLYGVGEANLTANDVVTVNGVECYVLSVDTAANTAQLITRNIYDVRFDNGGHGSSTPNLGTKRDSMDDFTDKTCNYKYSTLKTYMDNFYTNQLGSDSRIIQTNVKYYAMVYTTANVSPISPTTTPTGTVSQYVYALDAVEAKTNATKFGWTRNQKHELDFWLAAGFCDYKGRVQAYTVAYNGGYGYNYVNSSLCGARPAFTIDLTVTLTYDSTNGWKNGSDAIGVGDTITDSKVGNTGYVYVDGTTKAVNDTVSGKIVKIDGNKIYLCSSHATSGEGSAYGFCDRCCRDDSGKDSIEVLGALIQLADERGVIAEAEKAAYNAADRTLESCRQPCASLRAKTASITIKNAPTKTTYNVGDTIDVTGGKITATTLGGSTEDKDITSSMVSGFDSSTAGTKTVTVNYDGQTTTFEVTVSPSSTTIQTVNFSQYPTFFSDVEGKETIDKNPVTSSNEYEMTGYAYGFTKDMPSCIIVLHPKDGYSFDGNSETTIPTVNLSALGYDVETSVVNDELASQSSRYTKVDWADRYYEGHPTLQQGDLILSIHLVVDFDVRAVSSTEEPLDFSNPPCEIDYIESIGGALKQKVVEPAQGDMFIPYGLEEEGNMLYCIYVYDGTKWSYDYENFPSWSDVKTAMNSHAIYTFENVPVNSSNPTTNISGNLNKTTEAYVMTIPAGNTNLTLTDKTTAQSIGDLKITRTDADVTAGNAFNTAKKVSVTIASANGGNLKKDDNNKLAYTLGIGNTNVTSWTNNPVQDFAASVIDAETAVAMTVTITGDAASLANGTYQDQLTFTASVVNAN